MGSALPPGKTRPSTRLSLANEEKAKTDRFTDQIAKLVGAGAITRACQHLTSDGVQDARSEEVLVRLKTLHPTEVPPIAPLPPAGSQLEFGTSVEEVEVRLQALRKTIWAFPKESAPGPSGLRPDHLKDMLGELPGEHGAGLLLELDRFVIYSISQGWPSDMASVLCAARLAPLRKVSAGTFVEDPFGNSVPVTEAQEEGTRPIAAGETLRRLCAKVLMRTPAVLQAVRELHPPQVGVGVKSACPMVAMGVQQIVSHMHISRNDSWAVLQVDFRNAFNCVSRQKLLDSIAERCPEALRWFNTCYAQHSNLYVGDTTIRSESGLQQGDPGGLQDSAGRCMIYARP